MDNGSREGPHAFNRFLALLGDGSAHAELSAQLHKLAQALQLESSSQGKKVSGELTLKIKLVADDGMVGAAYEISRKEPAPRRPGSVFWITKGGNLTPNNPRQTELPLRDVTGGRGEARDLGDDNEAREV